MKSLDTPEGLPISAFVVGDLVVASEPVISYNFGREDHDKSGKYISRNTTMMIVGVKMFGVREFIQVLTNDGTTWLHRGTYVTKA